MSQSKKNMVWLTSYPKSGNTWVRVLLANYFSDSHKPISINQIDSSIISSSRLMFDYNIPFSSSDLSAEEIDLLRPDVYRAINNESDSIQFIKTHDAFTLNAEQSPLFPVDVTKAVVYIVRNPLDVAISFAHHSSISIARSINNLNNSQFSLVGGNNRLYNQLRQKLLSWSEHYLSWENSSYPFYLIRYEDLKKDTTKVFSELLLHLYGSLDKDRVEKAVYFSDFNELKKQEEINDFKEKPFHAESFFRSGKADAWKKELNKEQIELIISHHKFVMQKLDYLS